MLPVSACTETERGSTAAHPWAEPRSRWRLFWQSARRPGAGQRTGRETWPPQVSPKIENAIKTHLSAGKGILKVATLVGVGSGTVQRVKREMVKTLARAA